MDDAAVRGMPPEDRRKAAAYFRERIAELEACDNYHEIRDQVDDLRDFLRLLEVPA